MCRELECWAEFLFTDIEGLGHSGSTVISRAVNGQLRNGGHSQSDSE